MSVLMLVPTGTPFEDGIFMFDLQLTSNFPLKPPMIHYVSYTYEISPMLSWDGNFCVGSLDWNFKEEPISYVVNCVSQMQCNTPENIYKFVHVYRTIISIFDGFRSIIQC